MWELTEYQKANLPTDYLFQDQKENVVVCEHGFVVLEPYPGFFLKRELTHYDCN